MGGASFFGGLLGEIGQEFQRRSDLQRRLNLARGEAELNFWGNLLQRPDLVPEARGEVMNRWFDTLGAMGDKKAAKVLTPARDFSTKLMGTVFPGRQEKPAQPAQTLAELPAMMQLGEREPMSAAPTAIPSPVSRIELAPVPGVPERRGPFYTPEELAQRQIDLSARSQEATAAAQARGRFPFQQQAEQQQHQNRMAEIRATQEGRIIRGVAVPDPRENSNPWDYVTPIFRGDGTTTFEAARRPASIETAFQTAQAVAKKENIPVRDAWERVWAQGYEAKEQIEGTRKAAEKERTQRMSERTQRMGERSQRMELRAKAKKGLLTPQEARMLINTIASTVTRRMSNFLDPIVKERLSYEKALEKVGQQLYGVSIDSLRQAVRGNPFAVSGPSGGEIKAPGANPF